MSVKLEDQVKSIAKDLGFEDCRFARAQKASHAEEFQDSAKPGGIISDPMKEDLIRRGFTPEEAEEWLQMT